MMKSDWHDARQIALAVLNMFMEQFLTLPRVLMDPFLSAHSLSKY